MPKPKLSQRVKETALLTAVILLTLVALSPLLRSDQPCTHDGGLHYHRIVAMRQALDDGLLASRWVPDLAFGYGYPFFNYRAAVSYYLGLGLYLSGLSLPQALNLVYAISITVAAVGAFLLGRDLLGPAAGVVTAVAYVYAPYVFIDALVRGNMPESAALALFPWILWAFRRLLLSGKARYLLASAGLLALLWLSHNISSLLFTPFLALYVLVVWLARGRRDHLLQTIVSLALGIGLTAFFWAPAVLEKEDVQLHMSRTTRNNDYHYNFVNLSEVLAPPEAADTALLNPPMRVPLGLGPAILALLGTVLALWRWRGGFASADDAPEDKADQLQRRERWTSVIFFALSGLVMIFMSTRASVAIWESIPLIPFVQFPWRLVGRAVLPFSLLAGALVGALAPKAQKASPPHPEPVEGRLSWLIALGSVALLILVALPLAYPPSGYCAAKAQPDIQDVFGYEHGTGLVGVDPEGSYFPVTVQRRPLGSPLEAQYAALLANREGERAPIARFDADSLPQGAAVHSAEYRPNYARLELETPSVARARYLAFAFPGWRVLIDGQPADIIPSDPEGLITFDLPAGRHVVEVDWASTPIRSGATMISLVALAGVAFITYSAARSHLAGRIRSEAPAGEAVDDGSPVSLARRSVISWAFVLLLALLALLLLGLKLAAVDRNDTPFRGSGLRADGTLRGADVPLDIRLADGVRLLGFEQSTDEMPADGTLHLALYWGAYARPTRNYRSTVALVDANGKLWSAKTAFPRRGYADMPPSPTWGDGRYVVEGFDVEPFPGTPPGSYDLLLTAFDRETLVPLNILDEAGQVIGPSQIIGQVELTRPDRPPNQADIAMGARLDAAVGPLVLAGANLDRTEAAPGDPMSISLFWLVPDAADPSHDLTLHLALVDDAGEPARTWDLPPVRADWPTSLWQPGDLWRGQHVLRLPGSLDSGTYTWQLSLFDAQLSDASTAPSQPPVQLGQLRIHSPQRLWQAPPLQLPLDADLGQQVTLLGANLQPSTALTGTLQPASSLNVMLAWQAQQEMQTSYRVFLHLLGPDGNLWAQSDGEPAAWSRPTTGWAPGEVVLDGRTLQIPPDAPPGSYTLLTGMYDLQAAERLPLPDGTTAALVTTLTVNEP